MCQKGQFTLQLCPSRWFVRKIFDYYPPKVKIEKIFIEMFACPNRRFLGNSLSKRQVGRVLAKSLPSDDMYEPNSFRYCEVQNNNMEVILATLTSGSDLLILQSVNICSILFLKGISSHNYTRSIENHMYIHRHTYVHVVINECLTVCNRI